QNIYRGRDQTENCRRCRQDQCGIGQCGGRSQAACRSGHDGTGCRPESIERCPECSQSSKRRVCRRPKSNQRRDRGEPVRESSPTGEAASLKGGRGGAAATQGQSRQRCCGAQCPQSGDRTAAGGCGRSAAQIVTALTLGAAVHIVVDVARSISLAQLKRQT